MVDDVPPTPPDPPMPAPLGENPWPFLEHVIRERHPPLLDDLRPGASDAELDAAQAKLGVTLPDAFRMFYRGHDGQTGAQPGLGFFFGCKFLSLAEIVSKHAFWQELMTSDPQTYGKEGDSKIQPPGAIRSEYINPAWIAFADDGSGNHIGLDFAPGPSGTAGQCITFGRDQHTKFLLGKSFADFVRWIQPRFWPGHSEFRVLEGFGSPAPMSFGLAALASPDSIGLIKLLHEN